MTALKARNKRLFVGAAGVFALVILTVAVMVSGSEATGAPEAPEVFSVLQHPLPASVVLPEGAEEWLESLDDVDGMDSPPSTVGVANTATGNQVVVAGSTESVCFYNLDVGTSNCADAALAASGRIYTASPDSSSSPDGCDGWSITGLMPDGVESVRLDMPGGKHQTVPVISNVYTVVVPPVHATISSGPTTTEIPLDEFAAGNTGC